MQAAEQLGEQRIIGWALEGGGETDVLEGDLRLGEVRTRRALKIVREQEDRITEVECLRVLALIARRGGDLDRAEELARDSLRLATELQNPWMIAKTSEELGHVLNARGESGEASEAYHAASQAFARTGAETRAKAMREKSATVP